MKLVGKMVRKGMLIFLVLATFLTIFQTEEIGPHEADLQTETAFQDTKYSGVVPNDICDLSSACISIVLLPDFGHAVLYDQFNNDRRKPTSSGQAPDRLSEDLAPPPRA